MCVSMVLEFYIKGGTDIIDGRRRQHLVVLADTESGQLLPVWSQPTVQHFEADTGCTCQFGFIHCFIIHCFACFCSLLLILGFSLFGFPACFAGWGPRKNRALLRKCTFFGGEEEAQQLHLLRSNLIVDCRFRRKTSKNGGALAAVYGHKKRDGAR